VSGRLSAQALSELALTLSERDRRVLELAYELRLVCARHVEGLIFTDGSPLTQARRTRLALARLTNLGVLARLERRIGGVRAGSSGYVYRLSYAGRRLLGLRSEAGWREPGLAYVDHTLAAADLHLRLTAAIPTGQLEGFDLEHEPSAWRRFTGLGGDQQWLKPDLFARILTADFELFWFVEIDRGTEGTISIRTKAEQYLAYWRTGAEQGRFGVFPRVAWVTPDSRRAEAIERAVAGLPPAAQALMVATTDQAAIHTLTNSNPPEGGDS